MLKKYDAVAELTAEDSRFPRTLISVLGCAIVYAIAISIIRHFSFNWPHNDDFEMLAWLNTASASKWGFLDLFLVHNGSHPIGIQAIFYTALFSIFGVNFVVGVVVNSIVIVAGSIYFSDFLAKQLSYRYMFYAVPLIITMITFRPVQVDHLTWSFEFGWFLINTIIITNAVLIERYRDRSTLYVLILSFVAAFSSAHGAIVWACAAMHYLLLPRTRRSIISSATMLAGFALDAAYVFAITPRGEGVVQITSFGEFASYVVSIFGAVFGVRDQYALWLGGALILLFGAAAVLCGVSTMRKQPLGRVGAVLTVGGAGFLLIFIKGRFQYGLAWAVSDFHMGPMFVPLLLGEMVFFLNIVNERGYSVLSKAAAWCGAGLLLGSVASAAPYANEKGNLSLAKNSIAMYVTCHDGYSDYIVERSNIDKGFISFINGVKPRLRPLCSDKAPKITKEILAVRDYYAQLGTEHPKSKEALAMLWDVYASHLDLLSAYPPKDHATPLNLLEWAIGDASEGGVYESESLGRYREEFGALGRDMGL